MEGEARRADGAQQRPARGSSSDGRPPSASDGDEIATLRATVEYLRAQLGERVQSLNEAWQDEQARVQRKVTQLHRQLADAQAKSLQHQTEMRAHILASAATSADAQVRELNAEVLRLQAAAAAAAAAESQAKEDASAARAEARTSEREAEALRRAHAASEAEVARLHARLEAEKARAPAPAEGKGAREHAAAEARLAASAAKLRAARGMLGAQQQQLLEANAAARCRAARALLAAAWGARASRALWVWREAVARRSGEEARVRSGDLTDRDAELREKARELAAREKAIGAAEGAAEAARRAAERAEEEARRAHAAHEAQAVAARARVREAEAAADEQVRRARRGSEQAMAHAAEAQRRFERQALISRVAKLGAAVVQCRMHQLASCVAAWRAAALRPAAAAAEAEAMAPAVTRRLDALHLEAKDVAEAVHDGAAAGQWSVLHSMCLELVEELHATRARLAEAEAVVGPACATRSAATSPYSPSRRSMTHATTATSPRHLPPTQLHSAATSPVVARTSPLRHTPPHEAAAGASPPLLRPALPGAAEAGAASRKDLARRSLTLSIPPAPAEDGEALWRIDALTPLEGGAANRPRTPPPAERRADYAVPAALPAHASHGSSEAEELFASVASTLVNEVSECRREIQAIRGELAQESHYRASSKPMLDPAATYSFASATHPSGGSTPIQEASALLLQACAHNYRFSSGSGTSRSSFAPPAYGTLKAPLSGYGSAYTPGHDGLPEPSRWRAEVRAGWHARVSPATVAPVYHGRPERAARGSHRWSASVR
ncbi:hypothetical protein AB1Y20_011784 [Prymnesium parvum]|uniref:Centrosomal protein POC5 n=1 Tax=Prymnesium parvum TaxID=97485 RepID=A0AB34IHA9_PRYPA